MQPLLSVCILNICFFPAKSLLSPACLCTPQQPKQKQQSEEADSNWQTWQSLAENMSITHQLKKHCTRNKIPAENPLLAENPHGAEYKSLKKRCAEEQLSVVGWMKVLWGGDGKIYIPTSRKCPEIPGKRTKSNSDFWRTIPLSKGFRKCMFFKVKLVYRAGRAYY